MYCKKCGQLCESNMKFCSNCGFSLNDTVSKKNVNLSKRFSVASLVMAIFLLVSVIGKQEQIAIIMLAGITLILSIISIIESFRYKQNSVVAYITMIYAFVCLTVQISMI